MLSSHQAAAAGKHFLHFSVSDVLGCSEIEVLLAMCLFLCAAACCQAPLMPCSVAMASPSLELAEFSQVSRQLNSL